MSNALKVGDLIKIEHEYWHIKHMPATTWHERFFYLNRLYVLSSLINPEKEMQVSEKYMNRLMRETFVITNSIES